MRTKIKTKLIYKPKDFIIKNDKVLVKLCKIARDGFGTAITDEDVYNHTTQCHQLVLGYYYNELVGFSSCKIYKQIDVLFFYGTVIKKNFQKYGLNQAMKRVILDKNDTLKYLACTTQNPVVFKYFKTFCSKVFLNPDIPLEIFKIGNKIVKGINPTFILRDFYPECLYPAIPLSGDKVIDDWFKRNFYFSRDFKTRDAALLFGERK